MELPKISVKICPLCRTRSITKRQNLSPKYRCQKCGYTFSIPAFKDVPDIRQTLKIPPTLQKRVHHN